MKKIYKRFYVIPFDFFNPWTTEAPLGIISGALALFKAPTRESMDENIPEMSKIAERGLPEDPLWRSIEEDLGGTLEKKP